MYASESPPPSFYSPSYPTIPPLSQTFLYPQPPHPLLHDLLLTPLPHLPLHLHQPLHDTETALSNPEYDFPISLLTPTPTPPLSINPHTPMANASLMTGGQ